MASLHQHQYGLLYSKTWCMHSPVGLVICPCNLWGKAFPSLGVVPELLHHCIPVCNLILSDSRVMHVPQQKGGEQSALVEPWWSGEQQCLC